MKIREGLGATDSRRVPFCTSFGTAMTNFSQPSKLIVFRLFYSVCISRTANVFQKETRRHGGGHLNVHPRMCVLFGPS